MQKIKSQQSEFGIKQDFYFILKFNTEFIFFIFYFLILYSVF